MTANATIGTGIAITFSTGFAAEIISVKHSGYSRPVIDTTNHSTSTARTFMPGSLATPGELDVEIVFDQSTKPPINGAAETVTVTFSDATTWAASGFMTDFEYESPLEDKMMARMKITLTGDVTVT
jgi:hypothetical protein